MVANPWVDRWRVGWYGAPFTELRNYDSNIVPVGGEYVDDVSPRYFNNRKSTDDGGSSEVQRKRAGQGDVGPLEPNIAPAKPRGLLSTDGQQT